MFVFKVNTTNLVSEHRTVMWHKGIAEIKLNSIKKVAWLFAVHVALMLSELYDKWVTDAEPLSWGSRVETDTLGSLVGVGGGRQKHRRELVMGREGWVGVVLVWRVVVWWGMWKGSHTCNYHQHQSLFVHCRMRTFHDKLYSFVSYKFNPRWNPYIRPI